jgi:dihydrofolate reductase
MGKPAIKKSLVVAMAEDRVIGKNNSLPWHVPADLRNFREITFQKPIIMGRRTFESIGKPLKGRVNIVVTRDRSFFHSGVIIAGEIDEALEIAASKIEKHDRDLEEVMVIGGEQIFRLAMEEADRIYLTEIEIKIEGGDALFPEFDPNDWSMSSSCILCEAHGEQPRATHSIWDRRAA